MAEEEVHGVVIVGGGICGLATALAFHRKGMSSLVLERSESLRATGAAIGLRENAWRVLDRLGVADRLRANSLPLTGLRTDARSIDMRNIASAGEFRCVARKDLVEALAAALPPTAIRFGYCIDGITTDPVTRYPILHTSDGRSIKAKMLIGCDGSNSAVAKYLGLKPATSFPLAALRGFTTYPGGHSFGTAGVRLQAKGTVFGFVPINPNLVHFVFTVPAHESLGNIRDSAEQMRGLAMQLAQDLAGPEFADMVKRCDLDSLSLSRIWYRAPWHLLRASQFQRGAVTVAGDAMHVMGPFLGQGGAAGLEDAIVLARCVAPAMASSDESEGRELVEKIEAAQRMYVQERWGRLMYLSGSSYARGLVISATSPVKRLIFLAILLAFFGGFSDVRHTRFDCGPL